MRALRLLWVAVLAGPVLSGCLGLSGSCVDDDEARRLFDDARAWMDDLGATAFTLRVDGLEDVDGELVVSADPGDGAVQLERDGGTITFDHPYYSIDADGLSAYGRDHDDRNNLSTVVEGFLGDTVLLGDAPFSAYARTCGPVAGLDAVTFRHEDGGARDSMSVPRRGPAFPLEGARVDPDADLDLHFTVEPDSPSLRVDTSLERLPASIDILEFTFEDDGGRTVSSGTLGAETEWAPLSDLRLVVTEFSTGRERGTYSFEPGRHGVAGGHYELQDLDGNRLLSEGDFLVVDLESDASWELLDTWADAYVLY